MAPDDAVSLGADVAADVAAGDRVDGVATVTTSAGRASYLDLLRVVAIAAVVIGHWLATGIVYTHGRFDGVDVLGVVRWTSWLTLPFQVVPVFFFVGGNVNALSWSRYRGDASWRVWPGWVRRRMLRLLVPTCGYLVVVAAVVAVCQAAGANRDDLSQAAWAAALHLWFLAAYGVVVLLTPTLYAAHRRWGLGVPVVMGGLAVLIDLAAIEWHWHFIGWTNYVLVWGTFHQLGFAWRDGTFAGRRRAAALTVGAVLALVALVWPGPYPVNMVGVPGARIQNASPPSAALLAFGVVWVGAVVAAEPVLNRWLADAGRSTTRAVVRKAAGLSMPVYLWHMIPVVVVAIVGYPTQLFAQPAIGSGTWWIQRVWWIGACVVVLAAILGLLRVARLPRWRRASSAADSRPIHLVWSVGSTAVLLAGVGLAAVGLGRLAIGGFAPTGTLDVVSLVAFAVGLAAILRNPRPAGSRPGSTGSRY